MNAAATPLLPKAFWLVAVLALLWNLLGLAMFVMQVTMSPDTLAAMPAEQPEMLDATPTWLTAVFGLAVASGVIGAIGLLMRRRWGDVRGLVGGRAGPGPGRVPRDTGLVGLGGVGSGTAGAADRDRGGTAGVFAPCRASRRAVLTVALSGARGRLLHQRKPRGP